MKKLLLCTIISASLIFGTEIIEEVQQSVDNVVVELINEEGIDEDIVNNVCEEEKETEVGTDVIEVCIYS